MHILLLIILAYLFLPVMGELFLLLTNNSVIAGEVTWDLFFSNLIYSSIVYSILLIFYIFNIKKYKFFNISLSNSSKDYRTLRRISIVITLCCLIIFILSGYDYLIKGIDRGNIRVSLGGVGFLFTWIILYAVPLMLFITTSIMLSNKNKKNKKFIIYIYFIGIMSTIFTGYKYVIVFSFIPVFMLLFFNKNIIKSVILIFPVILVVLTITTQMVMGYSYQVSFNFLIHRMTVMTAFGTIGVWNHYPNGATFSESIKLSYSLFDNNIRQLLFDIDPNSVEALDTSLSRKITYMVYPSWQNALSGTTNVTVTNFGEAVYIFGGFYWIYAIFCGLCFGIFIHYIMKNFHKGNLIEGCLFLIYMLVVMLSWLNSNTIFSLVSIPIFIYLFMTYVFLISLLKIKF